MPSKEDFKNFSLLPRSLMPWFNWGSALFIFLAVLFVAIVLWNYYVVKPMTMMTMNNKERNTFKGQWLENQTWLQKESTSSPATFTPSTTMLTTMRYAPFANRISMRICQRRFASLIAAVSTSSTRNASQTGSKKKNQKARNLIVQFVELLSIFQMLRIEGRVNVKKDTKKISLKTRLNH